mmetsp:Transcript_13239/g.49106  ORF Transcript_13239/g.49106 Transcript_13239/m.49106 type:complete len:208 (-) Transcript_13239:154-777(-)
MMGRDAVVSSRLRERLVRLVGALSAADLIARLLRAGDKLRYASDPCSCRQWEAGAATVRAMVLKSPACLRSKCLWFCLRMLSFICAAVALARCLRSCSSLARDFSSRSWRSVSLSRSRCLRSSSRGDSSGRRACGMALRCSRLCGCGLAAEGGGGAKAATLRGRGGMSAGEPLASSVRSSCMASSNSSQVWLRPGDLSSSASVPFSL